MDPQDFNPYVVLNIALDANVDDIKKAYRKLSLVKHPDKQRDNPNAAEEFDELKRARDVLLEPSARAALDDVLRARARAKERVGQQDAKRQKLRQDLERRERSAGTARSELEAAQLRLKKELETLRARAAQREAEAQRARAAAVAAATDEARRRSAPAASASAPLPSAAAASGAAAQLLQRTVRATWSLETGSYDADTLRAAFSRVGAVDEVRIFPSRKRGKGSALVVMATPAGAAQAATASLGTDTAPLQVKLVPGDGLPDTTAGAGAPPSASHGGANGTSFPGASTSCGAPGASADHAQGTAAAAAAAFASAPRPVLFPAGAVPSVQLNASDAAAGGAKRSPSQQASGSDRAAAGLPASFPTTPGPTVTPTSVPLSFPSRSATQASTSQPPLQSNAGVPSSFPRTARSSEPQLQPQPQPQPQSSHNVGSVGSTPLSGVSQGSWEAAVAKNRHDELRRLSHRAELLARMQAEEEV